LVGAYTWFIVTCNELYAVEIVLFTKNLLEARARVRY
jgi:hypothetical protein